MDAKAANQGRARCFARRTANKLTMSGATHNVHLVHTVHLVHSPRTHQSK
jgi:hypothetical protein